MNNKIDKILNNNANNNSKIEVKEDKKIEVLEKELETKKEEISKIFENLKLED